MASSPLILAALAKSILPSAKFKQARSIPSEGRGHFNSALLTDVDGIQYVVRESKNAKGNLELATETQSVRAVRHAGPVRFNLPNLVAESTGPKGNTLQVLEFVYGSNVEVETLRSTDPVVSSIGLTIANIHSLNADAIRQAGMPDYSAVDVRESRLAELDRAASTGRIPAALLQRWEKALEDLDLFRFQPTVVHGNLVSNNLLELNDEISGVLGWSQLHIGDPAEDFASFAGSRDPELLDAVKFSYFEGREEADSNLSQRATLYSELAFAQYLVASISEGHMDEADWAVEELENISILVENGQARTLGKKSFVESAVVYEAYEEVVIEESFDGSDTKTRPIELPNRGDEQLF